ncbi:hypothetical protein BGW38_004576, partial [Lunasporangiospora selenospora]
MPESNLSPRPIDIPLNNLSEVEQENEGGSDVGRFAFDEVPDNSHDYTWTSLFGGTERVNADGDVEANSLQLNAEDVESWIAGKELEEVVKYKLKDTRPSQNTKGSFLKSVRYVCHRAGTYESQSRGRRSSEVQITRESDEMLTVSSSSPLFDPNEPLAPQKRKPASNPVPFVKRPRPNQKDSGKVACKASILIKYSKNNAMVDILHRPMHSNHGGECPVRLCRISKERKARILAFLNAGLSRRLIAKRFSRDVTPETEIGLTRVASVILSSGWSMEMLVGFPRAEDLHLVSCLLGNALCCSNLVPVSVSTPLTEPQKTALSSSHKVTSTGVSSFELSNATEVSREGSEGEDELSHIDLKVEREERKKEREKYDKEKDNLIAEYKEERKRLVWDMESLVMRYEEIVKSVEDKYSTGMVNLVTAYELRIRALESAFGEERKKVNEERKKIDEERKKTDEERKLRDELLRQL